jgi:hypothetical protein
MAQRHGKKGKARLKRMVLTFTDSPLDQKLYAALQQTAEADDTTLRPYLIKFYLRKVCGLLPPGHSLLKRMGLPDDLASIYGYPKDSLLRKVAKNWLEMKTLIKSINGIDSLGDQSLPTLVSRRSSAKPRNEPPN